MSDDHTAPDDDLLEFLGGIDELNEQSGGEDFTEFLANGDLERPTPPPQRSKPVPEEKK